LLEAVPLQLLTIGSGQPANGVVWISLEGWEALEDVLSLVVPGPVVVVEQPI